MVGCISLGEEEQQGVRLFVEGGREQAQDRSLLRGASYDTRGYAE